MGHPSDRGDYYPNDRKAPLRNAEWVHDKYRDYSPDRKESVGRNRSPGYSSGTATKVARIDSYKPALGSNGYKPPSRDRGEIGGDRYGIDTPTTYHTLHDQIIDKVLAAGISADSYYDAYYKYGQKAIDDRPDASAYWLLWRQEDMIWTKFFPEERFIGVQPKLRPTTWETQPTNFILMEGNKLMRTLKSSRAYGRLTLSSDPSKSLKNPPENPAHGYQGSLQSPSDFLRAKAREHKVPAEQLHLKWGEKYGFMKSRFGNQSKEWQHWYLEATVWNGLIVKKPYPGQEPKPGHHVKDNESIAPPSPDEYYSYSTLEKVMERMAKMKDIRREFYQYLNMTRHEAIAIHPRCVCYARHFLADRLTWQKFFKDPFPEAWPRQEHSRECRGPGGDAAPASARSQIATAPLKSPHVKIEESRAIAQKDDRSADAAKKPVESTPLKSEKSDKVILPPCPLSTCVVEPKPRRRNVSVSAQPESLHSRAIVDEEAYDEWSVVKLPPSNQPAGSVQRRIAEPPSGALHMRPVVKLPPSQQPAGSVQCRTVESQSPPETASVRPTVKLPTPLQSAASIDSGTKATELPAGQSCLQAVRGQLSASYLPQNTNPQSTLTGGLSSPAQDLQEKSVPLSVMMALTGARKKDQTLPDGILVVQNEEVTICNNSYTVSQMLRCLHAEDAASIKSISNGLTCHFRFKRNWNGDLLLWVEPFKREDAAAFSGGHCFLKGWVQRNICFGVVQPSFYWKEIQNHPGFRQTATTPSSTSATGSPMKSDSGNGTMSGKAPHDAAESLEQKADALLLVRGNSVEHVPCSRAALKNLAFSFLMDSSKERVEQRLRCHFSLHENKGLNKAGGPEVELVIKKPFGTDNEGFEKAILFLRSWALRAMEATPCKASSFLVSPEGLHILGRSVAVSGERLASSTRPLPTASDLDMLLTEETAKVEGSSRLVLDEVTGEVVTLRELLTMTLYRASAKILESSALVEAEDEEDDDYIEVLGTDGQMKDIGGGKFVVVKSRREYEALVPFQAKRKLEEDSDLVERAGKRVCSSLNDGANLPRTDQDANVETKENGLMAAVTPEPVQGKRKAEDKELGDRAEKRVCV